MKFTKEKAAFMSRVITKIGVGSLVGASEDRSQFLIVFKIQDLTDEYKNGRTFPGNMSHIWIDIDDILQFSDEESTPMPKRIIPSSRRKKK